MVCGYFFFIASAIPVRTKKRLTIDEVILIRLSILVFLKHILHCSSDGSSENTASGGDLRFLKLLCSIWLLTDLRILIVDSSFRSSL